jgi:ATP-dependent DNA helicase PIF1
MEVNNANANANGSEELTLSESQEEAFTAYEKGQNIFITGPGGSGKSALIGHIVTDAKESGKNVQVCALTGTAAVLLQCNAKTVHSWGGIGLAAGDIMAIANRVNKSRYKKKNWKIVDLLIIDEVSMMSKKLFELLDITAKLCRKSNRPFGGIQLIFTGDFFQLPPVGSRDEPETSQFCFESPLWHDVFDDQIALTKIFRQDDASYIKILNQLRVGKITKSTLSRLNTLVGRTIADGQEILPTILYPTRKRVDEINMRSLAALPSDEVEYDYTYCERDELNLSAEQVYLSTAADSEQINREKKYMVDNINFDSKVRLKVGAQVMCIANLDLEGTLPICNGSRGIVKSFGATGLPIVEFKHGAVLEIGHHKWQSETIPCIAVKQIPLILAWAITIHKSQGASLDMAEIDVGNNIFECGQTYVALSRVKSLEGLYLKSFDPTRIFINKKVRDFYDSFSSN